VAASSVEGAVVLSAGTVVESVVVAAVDSVVVSAGGSVVVSVGTVVSVPGGVGSVSPTAVVVSPLSVVSVEGGTVVVPSTGWVAVVVSPADGGVVLPPWVVLPLGVVLLPGVVGGVEGGTLLGSVAGVSPLWPVVVVVSPLSVVLPSEGLVVVEGLVGSSPVE
jgi:hypothetical protein